MKGFLDSNEAQERVGERNQNPGWTSDTVNVHIDTLRNTLAMKAHSEKFMNVSDMQVPDKDDRHDGPSRSKTIKANRKIVKDRIWINLVTSKIGIQPLEPYPDAQLHKERVISVRKAAEFASRVLQERCPR